MSSKRSCPDEDTKCGDEPTSKKVKQFIATPPPNTDQYFYDLVVPSGCRVRYFKETDRNITIVFRFVPGGTLPDNKDESKQVIQYGASIFRSKDKHGSWDKKLHRGLAIWRFNNCPVETGIDWSKLPTDDKQGQKMLQAGPSKWKTSVWTDLTDKQKRGAFFNCVLRKSLFPRGCWNKTLKKRVGDVQFVVQRVRENIK